MLRTWSLVAAGTVAAAVGLGTVTSHGVVVAALGPSTILGVAAGAVLVAVSSTLQFGLGPGVGLLADRVGVHRVVLLGAAAFGVGAGVAALSDGVALAVLAYAMGTGVAGACTLAPLLAAAATWHPRRRVAAVALVSAGNGLGALVLGPWVAGSIAVRGLAATWTLIAVVGAGLLAASAMVLRTSPTGAPRPTPWRFRRLLADRPLRRLYLAGVLGSTGLIATLTYLVPFGQELGLRPTQAAGLLGIVGAVGILSRLTVVVIPTTSAYRTYRATQLALAVSAVAWILAPAAPILLTVFAIVFGLAAGLWSSLAPLVVAEAYPDRLGSILGLLFTAPAVGGAVGPLVGGVLIASAPGSSLGTLIAGCFLVAHRILIPLRHERVGSGRSIPRRSGRHPGAGRCG